MLPVSCSLDLDIKVTGYTSGVVSLAVSVPVDLLESIPPLLNSLSALFSHARHRGRIASASARVWSPEEVEKRNRSSAARDAKILSVYDRFVSSGLTPRAAFMATKKDFISRGHEMTSYFVELVARDAGRLSKKRSVK